MSYNTRYNKAQVLAKSLIIKNTNVLDVHTLGYQIFPQQFTIDFDVNKFSEKVKSFSVIFGAKRSINDRKRKQRSLTKKDIRLLALTDQIDKWIFDILPYAAKTTWVELRSSQGCAQQAAHSDYFPDTLNGVHIEHIPLVCIAAIMPDTKIVVWPGALSAATLDKEHYEPMTIHMNAGDIVLFRGDLVHAGAKYDKINRRLHCYIDTIAVHHRDNRTWRIDFQDNDIQHKFI